MRCDECKKPAAALVRGYVAGEKKERYLCGECFERLCPERGENMDQETVNKRVIEKKWLRMIDLPGYKEWAAQFQGLDQMISDLSDYHVLVHPDEFDRPLDWIFEREYQEWLDEFADRGAPRRNLNEFKKS